MADRVTLLDEDPMLLDNEDPTLVDFVVELKEERGKVGGWVGDIVSDEARVDADAVTEKGNYTDRNDKIYWVSSLQTCILKQTSM